MHSRTFIFFVLCTLCVLSAAHETEGHRRSRKFGGVSHKIRDTVARRFRSSSEQREHRRAHLKERVIKMIENLKTLREGHPEASNTEIIGIFCSQKSSEEHPRFHKKCENCIEPHAEQIMEALDTEDSVESIVNIMKSCHKKVAGRQTWGKRLLKMVNI
ncbi:hypothetical protein P9112_003475 [Eukaryota sp. TZLM1-RC]